MIDNIVTYEHSIDTPFWCKLSMGNSSVAVGRTTDLDNHCYEIIDCYDGKQLAFRRLTGNSVIADVWFDLMMKAHCELIALEQVRVQQLGKEREFRQLAIDAMNHMAAINHMVVQLDATGCTADQLMWLRNAVFRMADAHQLIDDVQDPPE